MHSGSAGYLARITIRRRWRACAGVALLLGLTAGLSLFAIAGARRTQSALPRFLRAAHTSTLSVGSNRGFDPAATAAIGRMPEVVQQRTFVGIDVFVLADGRADVAKTPAASGSLDGRYFDQDRFTATRGRVPDPTKVAEVAVNQQAAQRFGYHVGQRLELGLYDFESTAAPSFVTDPPEPNERQVVTIVGIGLFPDEVVQDDGDREPRLLLTPAFTDRASDYVTFGQAGLVLERGDADIPAVRRQLAPLDPGGSFDYRVTSNDAFHGLQATRPLAVALAIFGAITGVAGLVLVGQALGRLLRDGRDERAILRALGTPPAVIARSALGAPAVAIGAGTVLAIAVAWAASPLAPIGPVRRVDGGPALDLDATVLGVGGLGVAVALLAFACLLVWLGSPGRLATRSPSPARPSRVVAGASSAGMPLAAVAGLRLALEPAGARTPVTGRTVIVGAAIAITSLVGSVAFGASLQALLDRPDLYGWNWDSAIVAAGGYGNIDAEKAATILEDDPDVAGWAGATFGSGSLDGQDVPLLGVDIGADVAPTILEGRAIAGPDEIALGAATADALGKGIGDTVTIGGGDLDQDATVVGIATLPSIGMVHAAHTSLGTGAVVYRKLVPGWDTDLTETEVGDFGPSAIFVRYRPGTDADAELAHLQETTAPLNTAALDQVGVQRPAEIVNSRSIGNAPVLLAVALAAGAMVSLALALGAAVRHRRRELALLKTLGFTRRQLSATVAWQATATAAGGLLVGVPLGVVIGPELWRRFADQLDVPARPTVPVLALVAVAGGAIAIANLAAAAPARLARRVDASTVLRSE